MQDYPLNSDYLSLVCSPLEKKFSFCQLNSINSFEYISAADPVNYLSTAPNSYNLGCTIVQQHGLPICWAATVASIGLKLTGISRSAEYVSNYMLGEYDGENTVHAVKPVDPAADPVWCNFLCIDVPAVHNQPMG